MLAHLFSALDAVCVLVAWVMLPCIPVAVVLAIWLRWRMPKPQLRKSFAIEDSPRVLAVRSICRWCCRVAAACGVLLMLLALLLIRNDEPDGSFVFGFGLVHCAVAAALVTWIRRQARST